MSRHSRNSNSPRDGSTQSGTFVTFTNSIMRKKSISVMLPHSMTLFPRFTLKIRQRPATGLLAATLRFRVVFYKCPRCVGCGMPLVEGSLHAATIASGSGGSRGRNRHGRFQTLAALKSTPALIGSPHKFFRPQQQSRWSVNPFKSVPAVPSGALHANTVGGSEGGAVVAKKLDYALAPDIESPAFVPFRANPEDANCRLERVDIFLHRQKL